MTKTTRERAIEIAKLAAAGTHRPKYHTGSDFEPHEWVIDAVEAALDPRDTVHRESLGALVDALRRGDAAEIAAAFRVAGMRLGIQAIADAPCIRVQPFAPAPGDGPFEQWSRWLLTQSACDLSAWSASQFSRLCTALAAVAPQGPEIPR